MFARTRLFAVLILFVLSFSLLSGQEIFGESAGGKEVLGVPISFGGFYRIRYYYTSTQGVSPAGPYGEPLVEGGKLSFLLKPQVEIMPSENITIGAYFRLTNIDRSIIWGSPDYFTNILVSPYLRIDYGPLGVDMGYFREHMTELTVMRWDKDDNPPGAGGVEGGCRSCVGLPGEMSFENLEEIDKDIGLEGLRINVSVPVKSVELDFKSFYARPTKQDELCDVLTRHFICGELGGNYESDVFSGWARVRMMNIQDEQGSCAFSLNPMLWQNVASGDFGFSVYWVKLQAERAWCRTKHRPVDRIGAWKVHEGRAFLVRLTAEPQVGPVLLGLDLAKLNLESGYDAEYRAQSYYSGEDGIRATVKGEAKFGKLDLNSAFFYKDVENAVKPLSADTLNIRTLGVNIGGGLEIGNVYISGSVSGSREKSKKVGDVDDEQKRDIYVLELSVKPVTMMTISFNVMYTETDGDIARIFSLMTSVDF